MSNYFAGGVVFTNIDSGMDVLWKASFKYGMPDRETVALFVAEGMIILPNHQNRTHSGRVSALELHYENDTLHVYHDHVYKKVLGIIHTHPNKDSPSIPAPEKDYQYCQRGIKNYVVAQDAIYEAWKDEQGTERYRRLGARTDYHLIPLKIEIERKRKDN